MPLPPRTLTDANIESLLETYLAAVETVGDSITSLRGVALLKALKRGTVGVGPYPTVAPFETANRIMTDLVILNGIKWLLRTGSFPFKEYTVELGHENYGHHDIEAAANGKALIGEAFNVAPSFFSIKKASALKKLRASTVPAEYRLIVCNHDAVESAYAPKPRPGEFFVFVDIGSGDANVLPNLASQPSGGWREIIEE